MQRNGLYNDERTNRERKILSEMLAHTQLNTTQQEQIKECYIQHNTVQSTSWKMDMSKDEVRLWYYRMSLALMRESIPKNEKC